MKFLITGGAGYIGSHCARTLQREGHDVAVFDNLAHGARESLPEGIAFYLGDIRQAAEIGAVIATVKPDVVFHFAALALVGESVSNPALYYDTNVLGMMHLLQCLRSFNPATPFVFSSTCAVFGEPESLPIKEDARKNPISPYGATKLAAEAMLQDYVRAYGMRAMMLRYFNACGAESSGEFGEDHDPETHLIPTILRRQLEGQAITIHGNDFKTRDGTCGRDYIHVDDIATAHIKAAAYLAKQEPGLCEVIHLGTGQSRTILEIIQAVEKVTGKPVHYQFGPRRPGDPDELYSDPSKAEKLLGLKWESSDLTHIIKTSAAWHSKHPKGYRNKRLHMA